MNKIISKSTNDTEKIGESVANKLCGNEVIALFGGLGMGKTAFTRGLAKGLGLDCDVTSPTFALVHEYRGDKITLYHFDMYRVETVDDLYSTGFFDYYRKGSVIACEWSENIENALPENTLRIYIERGEHDEQRNFKIEGYGEYENFVC